MRQAIPAEEKLAVTLWFLATGESFPRLQYQFRIHRTTIAAFIPVVCKMIYQVLKDEYFRMPETKEEWLYYARKTAERCQFPNCIGAADGKHISMLHPVGSGSAYYNYKGYFSIVLLALVDYNYKFLFVDVRCQGSISDGGVYRNSPFYDAIQKGTLNLPDPEFSITGYQGCGESAKMCLGYR